MWSESGMLVSTGKEPLSNIYRKKLNRRTSLPDFQWVIDPAVLAEWSTEKTASRLVNAQCDGQVIARLH